MVQFSLNLWSDRLPGEPAVGDVPLEVPHLQPLALGAVEELFGAGAVEDRVTVLALTGGVQVEGVDRLLVLTDLADEAPAAADQTAGDVTEAETDSRGEAGHQLAGPELRQV